MTTAVWEAELTWTGSEFRRGVQLAVGADGKFEAVGELGRTATVRLAGVALLPGFVSAHSHAFQRELRGRGERFPDGAGSFWSWRDAMYALVGAFDRDTLARACERTFLEMRDAGITTVGEFHYLHHDAGSDFAFDRVVLDAAARAGIRIVLLQTFYASSGFGAPLSAQQRRFATTDAGRFWRQTDELAAALRHDTHSVGVAAHSIRAATPAQIAELYSETRRRGWPFHLHIEEQRAEIDGARAAYGSTPMSLLLGALGEGALASPGVTVVHATHTDPASLQRYLEIGGRVCVCPLTEANLGDGIPQFTTDAAAALCLGTDSNARISMLEEMRHLEYGQRLRTERRGTLVDQDGNSARVLLGAATAVGARSLGLETGRLETGQWADAVAVRLASPSLQGVPDEELLDAIVFGGGNEIIAGTAVGGTWRRTGGRAEPVDPTSWAD